MKDILPAMTAAGEVRAAFTDLVSNAECELVIPPGGRVYPKPGGAKAGVAHPGCPAIADLAVELDAFWCPACRWNGRISGAWAHDVIRAAGQVTA